MRTRGRTGGNGYISNNIILIKCMSNWPFYFALLILILLINIRVKETIIGGSSTGIPDTQVIEGGTIDNIQKSINYGESEFSKENDSISSQITQLMKERNAAIEEDNGIRREIDTCVNNLRAENERNVTLLENNATCKQNLNVEIGKTQTCNADVANTEVNITYLDIQQTDTQAALVECQYLRKNGNRPPVPPPNNEADSAIQQAIKAEEAKGTVYFYEKEKQKCDVEYQSAVNGWNARRAAEQAERERQEAERARNSQRSGCVIL